MLSLLKHIIITKTTKTCTNINFTIDVTGVTKQKFQYIFQILRRQCCLNATTSIIMITRYHYYDYAHQILAFFLLWSPNIITIIVITKYHYYNHDHQILFFLLLWSMMINDDHYYNHGHQISGEGCLLDRLQIQWPTTSELRLLGLSFLFLKRMAWKWRKES